MQVPPHKTTPDPPPLRILLYLNRRQTSVLQAPMLLHRQTSHLLAPYSARLTKYSYFFNACKLFSPASMSTVT